MKLLELMLLSDNHFKLRVQLCSSHTFQTILLQIRNCLTDIKSSLKFPIVVVVVVVLLKRLKIDKFSKLKQNVMANFGFRLSMFQF